MVIQQMWYFTLINQSQIPNAFAAETLVRAQKVSEECKKRGTWATYELTEIKKVLYQTNLCIKLNPMPCFWVLGYSIFTWHFSRYSKKNIDKLDAPYVLKLHKLMSKFL